VTQFKEGHDPVSLCSDQIEDQQERPAFAGLIAMYLAEGLTVFVLITCFGW